MQMQRTGFIERYLRMRQKVAHAMDTSGKELLPVQDASLQLLLRLLHCLLGTDTSAKPALGYTPPFAVVAVLVHKA
jgi:hypothetical protein